MLTDRTTNLARGTASRISPLFPTLLFFWICGLGAGCCHADLPLGLTKKAVAIDKVPDGPRATAKKAIPKVDFKEAWQNLDRQSSKLHFYEIRGRQASDGKIREVRVSPTGEILESE
jgi:hypothetical protein